MSVVYRKIRAVEDCMKTLEQAKIKPETLSPYTQVLRFSNLEYNFKCLELNKELLNALEKGEKYVQMNIFYITNLQIHNTVGPPIIPDSRTLKKIANW